MVLEGKFHGQRKSREWEIRGVSYNYETHCIFMKNHPRRAFLVCVVGVTFFGAPTFFFLTVLSLKGTQLKMCFFAPKFFRDRRANVYLGAPCHFQFLLNILRAA
ncbi:hypothetical protein Y032_0052g2198 [Ancylostoma ceylanicum]|uniref:Transmembrane protein n=1 Tax=Ancylostoma ceylanicum TaxID=53326 RepID=A0A016U8B4_9BILA|nr:hypothetical protein Y032_0052g2198 [Ancylostoma ceylanicum]